MPLTVITVKNAPLSLRGDLTKWMQEIATGVYVGNFNSRIREQLWSRVGESIGTGEATITYAYRNEIGYSFDTLHTERTVIDYEGIPLVQIPKKESHEKEAKLGFSVAAKLRKVKKNVLYKANLANRVREGLVFIDIETDGLDPLKNNIIEVGAVKVLRTEVTDLTILISIKDTLPKFITELTGITDAMLREEGVFLSVALERLRKFIGTHVLVGYNIDFDIFFLNQACRKLALPEITNSSFDLMKFVKRDNLFLPNYKLQTVVKEYKLEQAVEHRALVDAKVMYELSLKLNNFKKKFYET